jgi:hypothetical protein
MRIRSMSFHSVHRKPQAKQWSLRLIPRIIANLGERLNQEVATLVFFGREYRQDVPLQFIETALQFVHLAAPSNSSSLAQFSWFGWTLWTRLRAGSRAAEACIALTATVAIVQIVGVLTLCAAISAPAWTIGNEGSGIRITTTTISHIAAPSNSSSLAHSSMTPNYQKGESQTWPIFN